MYPLTDERHVRRAQRSEDESFWACHNEREEDQSGSPRESRITVAPRSVPVNNGCPLKRVTRERFVVEMRGLEPLTPSLQRRCSPS